MTNARAPKAFHLGRFGAWLRSPAPYLALTGYGLFLLTWYLTVDVFALGRFAPRRRGDHAHAR